MRVTRVQRIKSWNPGNEQQWGGSILHILTDTESLTTPPTRNGGERHRYPVLGRAYKRADCDAIGDTRGVLRHDHDDDVDVWDKGKDDGDDDKQRRRDDEFATST